MSQTTNPFRLRPSDQVGMFLTIAIAAVAIGTTAWIAISRLVEVLPGRDVPVLVPFIGEPSTLPIGPDGASVEVAVEQAVVTVPSPAIATQFALVAEPIVVGCSIIGAIVLLALLAWNLARGRAFTRANTRIIWWGSAVVTGGWVFGTVFQTMSVNGALSAVSEYTYDGIMFSTNWAPFFAVLTLAVIGAAFQIGERLQHEAEGLV
ncbi:hypothetical protein FLP10_12185 [Agromyces intestinalis]|uniref:DUF2975 domain-containing protein n=1 Tax=Agromyces intestinalis TaxID=2592652 RepID=A0A5C1YHL1_9MICO|nr:hypothetical protein [Agromyces intestinalis]QEO15088.1 hypothetical protein FLP10_12185 [Agromyces intestinalis]